jgi:hypothetical protein
VPQSGAYTIKLESDSQKITTVNTDYLVGQHAADSAKKAAARQPKAAHYHCCQQPSQTHPGQRMADVHRLTTVLQNPLALDYSDWATSL